MEINRKDIRKIQYLVYGVSYPSNHILWGLAGATEGFRTLAEAKAYAATSSSGADVFIFPISEPILASTVEFKEV